ncbi:MAG: glycosyl hydrolase, partial [Deltaproteobacteria bacterium]
RYVPVWIERTPFDWRDAILYNVFTDRFLDGDPGNDDRLEGVPFPSNNQGGDFSGVTRKIREGYFEDLGVNAIWLSPVIENIDHAEYGDDGRLYAPYHGYWPSAPRTVESRFGGEEALRDLIEAAHDRGIRILFDLTANHVHSEHVYNRLHPEWINPFDWCGDGDSWNTNPIGCWFMDYLPDLDYRHPDALHTLVEDALFWIETFDIDGFRIDAVKHMEPVFEEHLRARIREEIETDQVQFYLVGETFVGDWDWSGTSNQTVIREHVSEARLTGQFDFPLYWDIVRTFARDERNIPDLEAVLSQTEDYYGAQAIMSNFLGNQDVPRFISHAAGDISDVWGNGAKEQGWSDPPQAPTWHEPYQRLELAFTFLMTIEGVPLLYYGDEIGLPGAGDPDNRRMMNWEDPGAFGRETLAHLQALGQIRRAHKALSRGSRIPLLTSDEDVWVYARTMLTDKLVVALNRSGVERTVTVDLSGTGIPDGRTLTDELSGKRITVTGNRVTITLAPWQGAIFAL